MPLPAILQGTSADQPEQEQRQFPSILQGTEADPAVQSAKARVNISSDANPDEAAKSIGIGNNLGIDPSSVFNDFKNFSAINDTVTASKNVLSNKDLINYVNSHPLAAAVSKNDIADGKLNEFTQAIKTWNDHSVISQAALGFMKSFGSQGLGGSYMEAPKTIEEAQAHPYIGLAAAGIALFGSAPEVALRTVSGIIGGLAGAGSTLYGQVTGDYGGAHEAAEKFLQVAGDPGFWASIGPAGEAISLPFQMAFHNARMGHELRAVGIDAEIDRLHAQQAQADKQLLNKALSTVASTETREKAPELVGNLTRQIAGDSTIGVKADAIRKLYGDKVPQPDDGILGWVPRLQEQLASAEATGGDVSIPLADWLAKVEPEVAKELEDHIRAREGGMTVEEAKVHETPPAAVEGAGPVEDLRRANALQPLGSRFSLVEGEPIGEAHVYSIQDQGKDIGHLNITEEAEGKRLYVDDTGIEGGAGAIGTRGVRELANQLFTQFPKAEEITGEHVSGAKEKTGKESNRLTIKRPKPTQQLEPSDRKPFAPGALAALTQKQQAKFLKLKEKIQQDDANALSAQTLKDQRRKQTQEWKTNEAAMRAEVANEVTNSGLHQADEAIRGGLKIDPDSLTPEQRKALPKEFQGKGGKSPDDIASGYGYTTGDAMVEDLVKLAQSREASGLKPTAYRNRIISAVTERQMEAKYGDLDRNIVEEAKDQVLSETQEEMLHENVLALAEEAEAKGVKVELPITKGVLRDQIRDDLAKAPINSYSSDRYLADAGRAGRGAEEAWLDGNVAEAFRLAQAQRLAFMYAREASKIEKAKASLAKTAKRFSPREIDKFPAEYTNAIHEIMMKVGLDVDRDRADLTKETQALGYDNLQDFVEKYNKVGAIAGDQINIAPWLLSDKLNVDITKLPTEDFMDVKSAIDILVKKGRNEYKFDYQGQQADLKQWVKDRNEQLSQKFPMQRYPGTEGRIYKVKSTTREYIAALTNMETFFGRLDGRDKRGAFTKAFVYPAAESANHNAKLQREISKVVRDLDAMKDPNKLIDPPFLDPHSGMPWVRFTRKNFEAVIANMGNEYNWKAMVEGFGYSNDPKAIAEGRALDAKIIWDWVERNSTKEDIDRAQARGGIFNDLKEQHDTVERNLNGVASENISVRPFTMHGKTYQGWYHPILDDPIRIQAEHLRVDPETTPTNFWPSVSTGFTKKRTGAKHIIDLNIDRVPAQFNLVAHAISFKDFVHNTNKVFKNEEFRNGISKYYGKEYLNEIDTWLTDIAGNASFDARGDARLNRISNYLRQNVMSTYIAFNPYTIQKHGLSAWMTSAREVGFKEFTRTFGEIGADFAYHAVADLFTKDPYLGNTLWQFIHDNSEEIQRRSRNWQETMMGSHDIVYGKSTLRNKISQWGSTGVALSDMLSAAPTWLAEYRKSFGELGDHGEAVNEANRAVRRAHGSTAITNLPRMVRRSGPLGSWMTTLYGYFGTIMQRRIELAHDVADTYHLLGQGELKAAVKNVPQISSGLIAYVVWPALVEEWVTSEFTDDRRGRGSKVLWGGMGAVANTFLGLRDIVYGLDHGREPGAGLLAGPASDLKKLVDDLKKPHPMSRAHAGKFIQDTITVFGDVSGRGPKIVGSAARYLVDTAAGQQRPQGAGDIWRGVTRGNQKSLVEK